MGKNMNEQGVTVRTDCLPSTSWYGKYQETLVYEYVHVEVSETFVASGKRDSSVSRSRVVTVRRISRNWTLVDCQLNNSVTSSQLHLKSSTELHSAGQVSSLYSLGADPTGNTASNTPSVFMGGCLAIAQNIFSARTCLPSSYQATRVRFCDRCIATVLHVTVLLLDDLVHSQEYSWCHLL
jgi:hypothetical protein